MVVEPRNCEPGLPRDVRPNGATHDVVIGMSSYGLCADGVVNKNVDRALPFDAVKKTTKVVVHHGKSCKKEHFRNCEMNNRFGATQIGRVSQEGMTASAFMAHSVWNESQICASGRSDAFEN